jgi:hypothetical protein
MLTSLFGFPVHHLLKILTKIPTEAASEQTRYAMHTNAAVRMPIFLRFLPQILQISKLEDGRSAASTSDFGPC